MLPESIKVLVFAAVMKRGFPIAVLKVLDIDFMLLNV